ncbi:hypothetical protein ACIA5G_44280 [Amycolatopsis sp. NPDC051758]|uniref:hypothetical protein n=1 Tax=Amycolatopsis sp. NPDC051758 TaxID=3363935 RepID=UPI00378C61F9
MGDHDLLGFLLIGLVFVLADGQFLYRDGRRYLGGRGGGAIASLVVTVFHLVAFGVLALLSVLGPAWSGSATALVGRVGVFLLLLAVAHALTLSELTRRRQDRRLGQRGLGSTEGEPAVTPVPGQPGRHPHVSPDLGDHGPLA